jgi:hypothetical protein
MARGRDVAHDLRVLIGDPPQDEEGASGTVPVEQLEDARHTTRNPALAVSPGLPRYDRVERRDLEVLLDIHGEVVRDCARFQRASAIKRQHSCWSGNVPWHESREREGRPVSEQEVG